MSLPYPQTPASRRSLWREAASDWLESSSVRLAAVLSLGTGIWLVVASFDAAPEGARGGAGASGLTWVAAVFRASAVYLACFAAAWLVRRRPAATLPVVVGLLALVALGWALGLGELDWRWMREHLRRSLGWVRWDFEHFGEFLRGYVPTMAAATLGLFLGYRYRM